MPASTKKPTTPSAPMTVAVTGPTGTFGSGLVPLLEADDRVGRVIGIARRPYDPGADGLTKMTYRQGDVRDESALAAAFEGADVVVHLAFLITGTARRETIREVNVEGTLSAFRAAAAAGAKRFVYASSVAAYGFHRDNPVGMTEDWATRPADHLFYAQEKAELEDLLRQEAEQHPEVDLYLLRPPVVVGPHAIGGKAPVPDGVLKAGGIAWRALRKLPRFVPVPAGGPVLQLVHESDVGQALLLCAVGAGPAGAYNISGDGLLSVADVVRELGGVPVPVPDGLVKGLARRVAGIPGLPPFAEWAEAFSHPMVGDTTRAKTELGWTPRYTSLEALRDTLPA